MNKRHQAKYQMKMNKDVNKYYTTFFALIWWNERESRVTIEASVGVSRMTLFTVVNTAFCKTHTDVKLIEDW